MTTNYGAVPVPSGFTSSTGPVNTSPGNGNGQGQDNGAPTSEPSGFYLTDGWYIAIACGGGLLLANTRVGPLWYSILGVAFIFQLTLTLQGK